MHAIWQAPAFKANPIQALSNFLATNVQAVSAQKPRPEGKGAKTMPKKIAKSVPSVQAPPIAKKPRPQGKGAKVKNGKKKENMKKANMR